AHRDRLHDRPFRSRIIFMSDALEKLVSEYDRGHMSRRDLIAALAAMVVAPPRIDVAEPAIGAVQQLNHVTIFVEDVPRSVQFYQKLFGMPLLTRQDPGINLAAGNGFLGIYPGQGPARGINHICLGLNNFDADTVLKQLTEEGLKANIRLRGDTKELYF